MVCIDDSESMKHTGAGRLACEALALVCQALSRLEVGQMPLTLTPTRTLTLSLTLALTLTLTLALTLTLTGTLALALTLTGCGGCAHSGHHGDPSHFQ